MTPKDLASTPSSPPHSLKPEVALVQFGSSSSGLTEVDVISRRQHWDLNQLPEATPLPVWRRWLRQLQDPFIYVLLASALISSGLQHWVDAGVILAVVLINASIGHFQEGRAEAALRSIRQLSSSQCLVIRAGQSLSLDSRQLVPGDLVTLGPGAKVPADLRLLECKGLYCDEALLTGESTPSAKLPDTLAADTPLAEQTNMAFMGTMVSRGNGLGLVVATGSYTQLGQINQLVESVTPLQTPLQQQLAQLAKQLTLLIFICTAITLAAGIFWRGLPLADMFQGAIGIAVAAIPEGLPAILTIALALGVERMAGQRALVRRLPSVEVLSSVDVICSDKTGTLTANVMTARALVTASDLYSVSGQGYDPSGVIANTQGRKLHLGDNPQLDQACRIALLCNDANLTREQGQWLIHGDPTEGALFVLAVKYGLVPLQCQNHWQRLDSLPFETEKRYMASLHRNPEGLHQIAVKGAPDRLLELCQYQLGSTGLEPLNTNYWHNQLQQLASQGMRVMALAYREFNHEESSRLPGLNHNHLQESLVMVALAGLADPPRPEAKAAIADCRRAGVRVIMITGDSPLTAQSIGRELGLNAARIVTGAELDTMSREDFARTAERVDIFARTSPANKLQLVELLQSRGHTLAMTGDGVNDAPALRRADIGVAMGKKGTDAAREASAFVLMDDNFATIVAALREARRVYDNIVKSIGFILPTDLAEASSIVLAILLGWTLPITPVQVLWINTVTAVSLTLALVFERGEANLLRRPPRPRQKPLVGPQLLYRILLVGGISSITVFSLFGWKLGQGGSLEAARAVAVNSLILLECFYLLSARSLTEQIWQAHYWKGSAPALWSILLVLLLQLGFSYLPICQQLFGVLGPSLNDWLIMLLAASPILVLVEVEKFIANRRQHSSTAWDTPDI